MDDESTNPSKEEPTDLLTRGVSNAQYNTYTAILTLYSISISNSSPHPIPRRFLTRLVRNLVTPHGEEIAGIFKEKGTATKPEIVELTSLSWTTVNRVVDVFVQGGLLKIHGYVGSPFWTTGKKVPIFGFHHAEPPEVLDAQKRYGAVVKRRFTKPHLGISQEKLLEAIALAKAYMDHNNIKIIPDTIRGLLKEKGIRVNYDRLVEALVKEGYAYA